ncbi:MAG: NUDIX hydrolase [Simkaniaceae bacterium]|nr:NUDIX hydrolase [Simkaniaceae bacterium]
MKQLLNGPLFQVFEDEQEHQWVKHPGAAVILPIEGDKIVFVKQHRNPVDQVLLELPAGVLEKGEDPKECAQRELREETGFGAKVLKPLFEFYSAPGFCNEKLHLFMAQELFLNPLHAEDTDKIEVVKMTLDEALQTKPSDAKTLLALYYLKASQ